MSLNFKGNDRGVSLYNKTKAHYESVKPIRGKRAAENIRPIGYRNRTWERMVEDVRIKNGVEEVWYGYRLYDTDVIMISPTGIIEARTDGWNSQSTAAFIHWVGRNYLDGMVGGRKYKNKIWVMDGIWSINNEYPILGVTAFQTGTVTNEYGSEVYVIKPITDIKEKVPAIDRKKMKEAMSPYMPMVNYVNSMMKLTGGLLSYDLRKNMADRVADNHWHDSFIYKFSTGLEMEEWNYYRYKPSGNELKSILHMLENGTEDDWMKMIMVMFKSFEYSRESVGSHAVEVRYGDKVHTNKVEHFDYTLNIKPTSIRDKVASWVKASNADVWKDKIVNHGL